MEVTLRDQSIADVLAMTVETALDFFWNYSRIRNRLQTLRDVGLGYIRLGQPATTLSGGEAQRVKLATELSRRATGRTLYLLDEPTTGLSFEDCAALLRVLHRLVDQGNSVLLIEHNLGPHQKLRLDHRPRPRRRRPRRQPAGLRHAGNAGADRGIPHRPLPPRNAATGRTRRHRRLASRKVNQNVHRNARGPTRLCICPAWS